MATADFRVNDSRGVRITISGAALDRVLRGQNGPIVKDLLRRGELIQQAAKRQIRLGHIHGGGGHGNLRDSIVKRVQSGKGLSAMPIVMVGSSHPIALIHHQGTAPHVIVPVKANALMWYGSGTASGMVFAKIVHHPGTKPNRYLTDNLHLAQG